MTRLQLDNLKYLNPLTLPKWEKTDYYTASMLDHAIPYIGGIRVTSTWRPMGSSAATMSFHNRGNICYAIDFEPLDKPMWHIFLILQSLGFRRIGLSPVQKIIHFDRGDDFGARTPYYFFEDRNGKDLGPLDAQPIRYLQNIPGYGTQPAQGPPAIMQYLLSDDKTATLLLAGAALAAKVLLFS